MLLCPHMPEPSSFEQMQPKHFSRMAREQEKTKAFPDSGISEIAHELTTELKLTFADQVHTTKKIDDLSVEVYDQTSDIRKRIADLQGEELAANIPKQDAALIVLRFPPHLAYKPESRFDDVAEAKKEITQTFWELRDYWQDAYNVQIERVNPIGEVNDVPMSGYYYIWLVTSPDKMPQQFLSPSIDEWS